MRWLDGCEFEQTQGDGEGQGSLLCCSPWDCKVLDVTLQLNNNNPCAILESSAQSQSCRPLLLFSHVQLSATPWTAACQAPLSSVS